MQFQTFGLTWVIVKRRRSVADVTLAVVQWSLCMSLLVFLVLHFLCRSCLYCGKCKFLCWISISSLCNSHLYDWKSDRDIPATTRNLSRLGGCLKQNEMDKSCKSRKTGIKGACKEDFNMGIHSLIRTILLEDQKPKSHLSVRIRSVIHTAQHNSSPLVSTV